MTVWLLLLCLGTPPKETNPVKLVAVSAIRLYQKFISPGQGDVCNFSPSCSQYSREAIGKYGALVGVLMTADRLMRCNPGAYKYYDTSYPGIKDGKLFDPPENNYIFKKSSVRHLKELINRP
jgi:putative membrane protein insertion efficiency factor